MINEEKSNTFERDVEITENMEKGKKEEAVVPSSDSDMNDVDEEEESNEGKKTEE